MVSERVRVLVWESLISAEARSDYFGALATKQQQREKQVSIGVGVLSSVACVNLISKAHVPLLSETLSAISAAASVMIGFARQSKLSSLGSKLCRTWAEVKDDYELLWQQLDRLNDDDALTRWRAIKEKHYEADESAHALPHNRKLLQVTQEKIYLRRGLSYGTATQHGAG
jgi:hypothetical protein